MTGISRRDVITLGFIRNWFRRLLPDKCEAPDCERYGVLGNENIIDGRIVCDYCHADLEGRLL